MKTDAKTTDKWLKKADKKAVKVVLLSTVFFIEKKYYLQDKLTLDCREQQTNTSFGSAQHK